MRLFLINCLLLASVAALPNEREKRDFSRIKNWISAIFGRQQIKIHAPPILETETEYKLFRLPGYDDKLVKVPKIPVVKEFMFPKMKPVNINAFGSVVGTKSNDETLVAVKEVNNLLSTGILNGRHNNLMKETIIPMFPALNTVKYVAESINPAPVIETRPVVTEVIKPYEDKLEVRVPFEPKYSYKQMQTNVPVMTYTAHNYSNAKEVETIEKKAELPMCVKKRIDDIVMLGADSYQLVPGQVYQFEPSPVLDISYPRVDTNSYTQKLVPGQIYHFQPSPVLDITYPRVDTNSYTQNQRKYGGMLTETFGIAAEFGSSPQPVKDGPVRYNLRPTKSKAIHSRPLSLHSQTYPHLNIVNIIASKANVKSQTSKVPHVFTNLGDKVKVSQTLGPIPPQYIPHSSGKGQVVATKDKTAVKTNGTSILGTKENASNGNIPSYVYNNVYNPNTGKVVKGNYTQTNVNIPQSSSKGQVVVTKDKTAIQTNGASILGTKGTASNEKNPSYAYSHVYNPNTGKVAKENYAPKTNVNTNTNTKAPNTPCAKVNYRVLPNKVTEKPQSVTASVISSSTSLPKENSLKANKQGVNTHTSFKDNPIAVAVADGKNDFYQQRNVTGSTVPVKGNKNGVAADVRENNKGRGDIPDQ